MYFFGVSCYFFFISDFIYLGPLSLFLKDFIYLFLERGEGNEKERERNINVWLPLTCPLLGTWPATQACALDWESNCQPFGFQAHTQSTELHQPGLFFLILNPGYTY